MSTATMPGLSGAVTRIPPVLFPIGIGQNCLFYTEAHRSSDARPAIVFGRSGRNQINLYEICNGRNVLREHVRHIDDPFFEKNPDRRNKEGAWDYVEVEGVGAIVNDLSGLDDTTQKLFFGEGAPEVLCQKVLEMHAAGKTPKQIACAVSVRGVNGDRVAAFLRLHNAKP